MSYIDLKENGSEAAVKAAGKLKQQGKTYESTSPPSFLSSLPRIFRRGVLAVFYPVTDERMLQ